jgi:ElaA protein
VDGQAQEQGPGTSVLTRSNGVNLQFQFRAFDDLTVHELYALLRLRSDVFVVEQDCVFLDLDDRDQAAVHVLARVEEAPEEAPVAYARFYEEHGELHLGRIVTDRTVRSQGAGHILMSACVAEIVRRHPGRAMAMSAQAHLAGFYAQHGFVVQGEGYLEDDIPHVRMVRG